MTHTPSAAPAEDFAQSIVVLLARERNTFAYAQLRDELHTLTANMVLAELEKPGTDNTLNVIMRYFAAAEVAVSILVNTLSSVVGLASTNDELAAAVGDIDLFRRSLGDHLCEGLLAPVSKLVNGRVLELMEGFAQRTAEATGK